MSEMCLYASRVTFGLDGDGHRSRDGCAARAPGRDTQREPSRHLRGRYVGSGLVNNYLIAIQHLASTGPSERALMGKKVSKRKGLRRDKTASISNAPPDTPEQNPPEEE